MKTLSIISIILSTICLITFLNLTEQVNAKGRPDVIIIAFILLYLISFSIVATVKVFKKNK